MSLVEEDGTGKANAESYCTVDFANTYFTARGNDTWTALVDAKKEQALRLATDFMMVRFRALWLGTRAVDNQALDWPRLNVKVEDRDVASDAVPIEVQKACSEYAYRASQNPLLPDIPYDETGRLPSKTVEKVGPIDEEVTYPTRGTMGVPLIVRPYPGADALVEIYLLSTSNSLYR